MKRRNPLLTGSSLVAASALAASGLVETAQAQQQASAQPAGGKPNILVVFGDDIGQSNISAYTFGLMGYLPADVSSI